MGKSAAIRSRCPKTENAPTMTKGRTFVSLRFFAKIPSAFCREKAFRRFALFDPLDLVRMRLPSRQARYPSLSLCQITTRNTGGEKSCVRRASFLRTDPKATDETRRRGSSLLGPTTNLTKRSPRTTTTTTTMKKLLWTLSTSLVLCMTTLVGLYYLIASPPLHLWYKSLPSVAGSSSVYVPGSGFSGFWYHLGTLNQMHDLHEYDYYCYSSGCLSVVLSFMNTSIDSVAHTALLLQDSWMQGNLTSYDLVHSFLHHLLPPEHQQQQDDEHDDMYHYASNSMDHFLPRIKVLVTTANDGVQVRQASNRQELVDLLIQTTWIPFVTGPGVGQLVAVPDDNDDSNNNNSNKNNNSTDYSRNNNSGGSGTIGDIYLDGGFSRRLHPPCRYSIHVPTTWSTFIHTLNPGLSHVLLKQFWDMGVRNGHPLATTTTSRPAGNNQQQQSEHFEHLDIMSR